MSATDTTLADLLAEAFPPLARYCPILPTVSSQQAMFLLWDGRESLYGGAVGGGKSAALLMAALQYVDVPGYRALLLRRTFAELTKGDALVPLSQEWLGPTDARWNEQRKTWTFPSGATLEFGHVQHEHSKTDYQGAAYAFVGFDELTHFSESQYDYIGFSRQRRRTNVAVPVRTRSSANPGGIGHMWVKRRFIDAPASEALFVPAKVSDNPGLDVVDYAASLSYLPDELRRQLMDGDWGAFEAQAFPTFGDLHLVDEFPLTDAVERAEGCDIGLNNPTAWYLVASDFDGNLIFWDSVYRPGLPSELAPMILSKRSDAWGHGNKVHADPSTWHRTGGLNRWGRPATLADEYTDNGIRLSPANNDPRAGYARLRELLEPDPARRFPEWHPRRGEFGSPRRVVVGARCVELVEQLRSAPLQPIDKLDGGEKIDPEWEGRHGHSTAAARYFCLSKPAASPQPRPAEPLTASELRKIALEEYEQKIENAPRRRRRYVNC